MKKRVAFVVKCAVGFNRNPRKFNRNHPFFNRNPPRPRTVLAVENGKRGMAVPHRRLCREGRHTGRPRRTRHPRQSQLSRSSRMSHFPQSCKSCLNPSPRSPNLHGQNRAGGRGLPPLPLEGAHGHPPSTLSTFSTRLISVPTPYSPCPTRPVKGRIYFNRKAAKYGILSSVSTGVKAWRQ